MAFPQLLYIASILAGWLLVGAVLWAISQAVYNLYFHPLRRFPGPLLHRAFRVPFVLRQLRGTLATDMLRIHEKYGPVVRTAPNELAFTDASAWKDIMGHRPGKEEVGKWEPFYRPIDGIPVDVISADKDEHAKLRRLIAHGFSDRSMREQEPIINSYVDQLIRQLKERSSGGKSVDMTTWYNFTTFDIIGDLAFGESFGSLRTGESHPWVENIFLSAKAGTILQAAAHYPLIKSFLVSLIPRSAMEAQENYMNFARDQLLKRMQSEKQRSDLVEGLLSKSTELNMSMRELVSNASLIVTGGSETTATLLAGVTYLLLMNPEKLAKLQEEVRSHFTLEEEITAQTASQLPYMLACLNEAFRMHPPVASGLPRVVPQGGITVNGDFIPEKTTVAIHHWATYHHSTNWSKPFEYHPERFLGDPEFASDKRDALQPFHIGTRNCVGRHLAYSEMRIILARVIFNFDMSIAEHSRDWIDQRFFNFWDKGPLDVYLTPRS